MLAILSRYLRAASRRLVAGRDQRARPVREPTGACAAEAGGDFAGEAERLGTATAQVHADLAEAFGRSELEPEAIRELAEQMYRRLDIAIATVPELARHADKIGDAYSDLAKLTSRRPLSACTATTTSARCMRTQTGWVVLDFEGEPASPLAQRRARSSPLRDVAGMLRSFDYAARHQLLAHPDAGRLAPTASDWVRRNSERVLRRRTPQAGGLDPAEQPGAAACHAAGQGGLRGLYEARHRPTWLPIPLESIAEFVDAQIECRHDTT